MPGEDLITDLKSRGGDVTTLAALARADDKSLQQTLKALGYLKLGERARVLTALKAVPEVLDVSDAAAPSTAPEDDDEPVGDSTMVMHGAVVDIHDDGGLLKTTLRQGDAATGTPPPLSKCKVRYIGSVLPQCVRFEAVVKEFHMGEQQVCGTRAERAAALHLPRLTLSPPLPPPPTGAKGHGEVREHHAKRRDL